MDGKIVNGKQSEEKNVNKSRAANWEHSIITYEVIISWPSERTFRL